MRRTMTFLIVLGLATPTLAQGPALEGDGTQVQSVDLLDEAISVTIESSGSMSLGRGEDDVSGGLGVTVNELDVELGHIGTPTGTDADDAPVSGITANPAPSVSGARSAAMAGGVADETSAADCATQSVSLAELTRALNGNLIVQVREVACPRLGAVVPLLNAEPRLLTRLTKAGIDADRVISITINNGTVIVYLVPAG